MSATKVTTLFTLVAFRDWIRVGTGQNTEDSRLIIAADAASEEFERETERVFVKRTLVTRRNGIGKIAQAFPFARPIASIDAFTIGGVAQDTWSGGAMPASYVVDPETGIIQFTGGGSFPVGYGNIVLTTTSGFDVQDGINLPRDVYRAGLDLAKAIYDELTTGAIAATSVSLGASTMVIKSAKRPPSVQRVIEKWTDPVLEA